MSLGSARNSDSESRTGRRTTRWTKLRTLVCRAGYKSRAAFIARSVKRRGNWNHHRRGARFEKLLFGCRGNGLRDVPAITVCSARVVVRDHTMDNPLRRSTASTCEGSQRIDNNCPSRSARDVTTASANVPWRNSIAWRRRHGTGAPSGGALAKTMSQYNVVGPMTPSHQIARPTWCSDRPAAKV